MGYRIKYISSLFLIDMKTLSFEICFPHNTSELPIIKDVHLTAQIVVTI